jgi:hypothetical protein
MIKGISGSQGVVVNGGNTSVPYVNQNTNNPMQGVVRVWGTDMQVFDGHAWINMATSYATVELDGNTQSLLKWVEAQRTMSMKRMEAVQKNPALTKAFESIARAEANFDILAKFVEHDDEPNIVVGYNFNAP